ncbi:MAG: DUF2828 family protein [Clostridia bacterium]|nr:DUF2828 family protein [Clostridia bacterium]
MLQYLKEQANKVYTENGAITNETTFSDCLDLFATIGAIRRESKEEIQSRFIKAYIEDKDMATKILFYSRDVRGGLGERKVFRVILDYLANNYQETVIKNLSYIAEYGRYDDILCLIGTPCEEQALKVLKEQFDVDVKNMKDGNEISLLAKWLPSVNASNKQTILMGKKVAKYFGMDDATYRKTLTKLRAYLKIIENNLRKKDYTFDYEKQPSKAMFKYRKAFLRNDKDRYNDYIDRVEKGEAKLNASTLAPYELVEPYISNYSLKKLSKKEKEVLNATWKSLPDYGTDENAIAVVDTSGSMYCYDKPIPASVALSLGLYFAERNKGYFKNHFIEFSSRPKLIEIKGESFADKLSYVASFSEVANTNVEAVFDLILKTAVKNKLPQSEMPTKLYLISDMEFDAVVDNADLSVFENAKKKFEEKGYELPTIVFWNVASRKRQQPVTKDEKGVVLVSGCTPKLFSMVASGDTNPLTFMIEVLSSERYAKITA